MTVIDLAGRLQEAAGRGADPADALVAAVSTVLAFSASSPARYHLMLQRTVPGFTPTPVANDPGGRRFIGRSEHAVRLFLAGVAARTDGEKPKAKGRKCG
jgi:hypothetical protein